jgi:hypothetical protein
MEWKERRKEIEGTGTSIPLPKKRLKSLPFVPPVNWQRRKEGIQMKEREGRKDDEGRNKDEGSRGARWGKELRKMKEGRKEGRKMKEGR